MRRALLLVVATCALWAAPGALASGWCGTGASPIDRPDVTTGPQVHAIWAVPSDGGDTFATGAPKLADDIASITAWWQGQDPTRIPRFDEAHFDNGATCLDISYVRLPDPASTFTAGSSAAFRRVITDLTLAGFANQWKSYYVYFDGPAVQTNVCGTGGGDFDSGPSYGITWLAGCPGVPTDSVGAHELLHALGALPDGAPHPCPGDSGHPCDSPQDVLYPYNSGAPLASLFLDFNHDDYYGHSGSWPDIQDSYFLHHFNEPVSPVTVLVRGGAGTVTSDLPGIACTADCTTQWDTWSPDLHLTATPGPQSRFVGWRAGPCVGADLCSLSTAQPENVTALFGPRTVPVKLAVTGRGRIACAACRATVPGGAVLTLRAVPAKGWKLSRWSGSCRGTRLLCVVTANAAVSARATFRKR